MTTRSLCVFTGSTPGRDPRHADLARALGGAMGRRGIRLVFGGGRVGLMGIVADAVLEAGGAAVGVIPRTLMEREVAHLGLTELIVTPDMHTRKARMAGLSDAFLALPGGYGTLEELFEVITWRQLGIHHKPMGLLDSGGFWDGLIAFVENVRQEGFIAPQAPRLERGDDPEAMLELLLP
jgi:hypothetical protein